MENESQTKQTKVLLAEYSEAGNICRWYEQLTRISLSVYLPVALALAGFIEGSAIDKTSKFLLCVGGLITSFLLINTILRQQAYYKTYIDRAKAIESKLGMSLYTNGASTEMPTLSIPNKTAIAATIGAFSIYFLASTIILLK